MSLEFHWICRSLSVTWSFLQCQFCQPLRYLGFFFPSCNIFNSFFSVFTFSLWSSLVSLVRFFSPTLLVHFAVFGWFQDIVNRMFCGVIFVFSWSREQVWFLCVDFVFCHFGGSLSKLWVCDEFSGVLSTRMCHPKAE